MPWLVACVVAGQLLALAPDTSGQLFGRRRGGQAAAPPAAPGVTVQVDRRVVSADGQITVEVRLSGDFERYEEPTFDGFEVESRGSSQQIQLVNGRMSQEKVLSFRLLPRKAGNFAIGPARVYQGGAVVAESSPVSIRVTPVAPPSPTTARAARDVRSAAARESVFVQVDTPRTTYYVGEPFLITWRLFYRRDVGVSGLEHVSDPRLEGLLAEELLDRGRQPRPREKRIGGQRFRYFDHSVRLATGLAPGEITIDTVTVRYVVGNLFRQTRHTVRSKPFKLTLKPVPTEGRPPAFREGNIGRFTFTASLRNADGAEPKRVQTGERLLMDVIVSGRGGLVGVKPPVIAESDAFDVELLPGNSDDEVTKDTDGMHGKRVFQYIVSATRPGEATTPAVQFAFFDPEAGVYRESRWPGVSLQVEGRAITSAEDGAALSGDDIRPNVQARELADHTPVAPLSAPWFWLLLGIPLAAVLLVEVQTHVRAALGANPEKRRARRAHGRAIKRLKLAETAARDRLVKDFYGQLSRCLEAYLEERVNIPAQGMTQEELRRACSDAGYLDETLDRLIDELDNCDFARFAPVADADASMKEAARRVEGLLVELEKVSPRRRP
ncbi:MAG: BatD family protein [Myxococcota bacterium]|jgi:hypothetical protein|nr:BatD family protein [Myxococcota bacterium]